MKRLFLKVMGGIHSALYRATGGKAGGTMLKVPILLLTTRGRKSGKERTTPLMFTRDADNLVLIASVGGAPKNPAWYWNLQGQDADVQIGSEHRRVHARDAEGEERERLWAEMVSLYPGYAEYQKKTTRQIPVVVLEPV
ncbi:MAG TPA: nitroreductase family deazaflavin-dependent oxidoreductase [Gaiellaceae bacterium]|jgi:deazaflavin-dependent oxidoreductase (nitroreductase family)|nr:nitroreductase family deazaflavin-dependent oxidoreductase [Gaiellaceae bacterium]